MTHDYGSRVGDNHPIIAVADGGRMRLNIQQLADMYLGSITTQCGYMGATYMTPLACFYLSVGGPTIPLGC